MDILDNLLPQLRWESSVSKADSDSDSDEIVFLTHKPDISACLCDNSPL